MMEFNFTDLDYAAIVAAEATFELLVAAYAVSRGDRTTRRIGLIYLLVLIGIFFAELATPRTKYYLLVDAPALAAMIAVTMRDPRPWALWACAFRLMLVATHVVYAFDHDIRGLAYATAGNTWILLSNVALLLGTIGVERRRRAAMRAAPA